MYDCVACRFGDWAGCKYKVCMFMNINVVLLLFRLSMYLATPMHVSAIEHRAAVLIHSTCSTTADHRPMSLPRASTRAAWERGRDELQHLPNRDTLRGLNHLRHSLVPHLESAQRFLSNLPFLFPNKVSSTFGNDLSVDPCVDPSLVA